MKAIARAWSDGDPGKWAWLWILRQPPFSGGAATALSRASVPETKTAFRLDFAHCELVVTLRGCARANLCVVDSLSRARELLNSKHSKCKRCQCGVLGC
eukprot:2887821-Amphidinium_carterae.1